MNDDTSNKLEVEVPVSFDAKQNAVNALIHGVRKGVEHLLNSYSVHVNQESPTVTVNVPNIIVEQNEKTSDAVYEDTNIDTTSE